MPENKFKGTGVALVTPFNADKRIDDLALEKLVNHVIDQGVNYLVALGTTAETPTLSADEKVHLLNKVVEINRGRVPLVCGIGGNNTAEVIELMYSYPLDNVDAILSVSPYYSKPTQTGIIAHYKEINKHTRKPIVLYNVPGRTGSNMTAGTTIKLANECEHIIAIKEASGNMVQCMELVKNRPEGFAILSGDDNLAMAQIACGFDGVISVAANCFTQMFCEMIQASLRHDFVKAQSLHYRLLTGIDLLFVEGNPAGAKCVLSELGILQNELRLPIVPVSSDTQQQIQEFLETLSN
jgi:4-hydroxy-tetrahydrodipicolinate synthase